MKGAKLIIPFGIYRDKEIEDIPSDYLNWLARSCDNEKITIEANKEYQFREKYNRHFWKD